MINLNESTFKTEVASSPVVVVDFWGAGCGPCRTMEPIFKAVSEKMENVKFAKIEPGEGMSAFVDFNVSHIPTFIVFKEGTEVDRRSGVMGEKELTDWVTEKSK